MSWVCFSVSLSHTQDFTHTHTLRHAHAHSSSHLTCLSSQSALVLLCGDACSHSDLISYSISNGCACCSLSDYCVSCVCYRSLFMSRYHQRSNHVLSCLVLLCSSKYLRCPVAASSKPISTSSLQDGSPLNWTIFCCVLFHPVLCHCTTDCLVLRLH